MKETQKKSRKEKRDVKENERDYREELNCWNTSSTHREKKKITDEDEEAGGEQHSLRRGRGRAKKLVERMGKKRRGKKKKSNGRKNMYVTVDSTSLHMCAPIRAPNFGSFLPFVAAAMLLLLFVCLSWPWSALGTLESRLKFSRRHEKCVFKIKTFKLPRTLCTRAERRRDV